MRQVVALVVLMAAVATVSGCADRANDLDTYYDAAARDARESPPSPSAPAATPPPVDPDLGRLVAAAELVDADVADEGVEAAEPRPAGGECVERIPAGSVPPAGGTWRYPSGSWLRQWVDGYADRPAAEVLGDVDCAAPELPVSMPEGVDAARGWCVDSACVVLLARGPLLSGVEVLAGSADRAAEAADRLAPITADALLRP